MAKQQDHLPSFRELLLLWAIHLTAIVMLILKGYATGPACVGMLLMAMISALTGARMERHRAELRARLEDTDGD